MKSLLKSTYLLSAVILASACSNQDLTTQSTNVSISADTVYTNAAIYTVNDNQPWADSVAIKDGKFIAVGSAEEIKAVTGKTTEVIDLKGSFVMPGLHDTHVHLEQGYIAGMLGDKVLTYTGQETSVKELQDKLLAHHKNNPGDDVLFAQNLPQPLFEGAPTNDFINEIISDRPVVMLTDTEHEGLLNDFALNMENVTAQTPSPEGGTIDKDADGNPTGYLRETASQIAWKHYPALTPEQHVEGLKDLVEYASSIGITSFKQQHAKEPIAQAAKTLEENNQLNVRMGLSWTWMGPLEPQPLDVQEQAIVDRAKYNTELIRANFVKLSLDGNAGSTGYALEPYLITGDHGDPVFPNDEDVFKQVERFDRMGMGITAHATTDAAIRQYLDAVSKVKEKYGELKARHQIAHATVIHPDDIPRIVGLNMTAEFSPVLWYPHPLTEFVIPQLGDERMKNFYAMNAVAETGARFVLASDGPLFWVGPYKALEAAVTRKDPTLNEDKALSAHQAITVKQAIKAMTIDSAYLMDQEDVVGSIEVGKTADIVVLSQNLLTIDADHIGETEVKRTIFNGKTVYDHTIDTVESSMEK